MRVSYLKPIAAVIVLIATITAFSLYLRQNPDVIVRLKDVPFTTLVFLFGLYGLFMVSLIWIQRATLALCDLRLQKKESSLLVMYSSIVNFFGPLQSGPGFRAAYLKARHSISLKRYTLATFFYYGFYALFSGILLSAVFVGAGALLLCVLSVFIAPFILQKLRFRNIPYLQLVELAGASLLQVLLLAAIYMVQLQSLGAHAAVGQVLAYTGAANFALFVSLTPGAIGFRESFLLFSQQLHGISSELIVAASLIDRSVYIVMLLFLAAIVFGLHAGDYLKINRAKK